MGRVVLQRVTLESCTHDLASIECILGEGLVVYLRAFATDPRRQEVLVVLRGAAIVTKISNLAGGFVGAPNYLLS